MSRLPESGSADFYFVLLRRRQVFFQKEVFDYLYLGLFLLDYDLLYVAFVVLEGLEDVGLRLVVGCTIFSCMILDR